VEKLAAKITEWKKNQASKTEEVSFILSKVVACVGGPAVGLRSRGLALLLFEAGDLFLGLLDVLCGN
jgi:hypothetical protein